MTKEQFEATRGNQYSAGDVIAGNAPYKVGDSLDFRHNSEEDAYLISDYPYGRQLRTIMKVWLEHDEKKGMRVAQQTQDPRNGHWNKPKKSTYSHALVMVFDSEGHLKSEEWSMMDPSKAAVFFERHRENLPKKVLCDLIFAENYQRSMDAAKKEAEQKGSSLEYGRPDYVIAHKIAMKEGTVAATKFMQSVKEE